MDIFILRFTNTHKEFRKIEFKYLCINNNINYTIIKDIEEDNPYMIIKIKSNDLDIILHRSIFIIKASYYIYTCDYNAIDNLDEKSIKEKIYSIISNIKYNTVRIKIDSYGCSIKQKGRERLIKSFSFLVRGAEVSLEESSLAYELSIINNILYISILYKNSNRKRFLLCSVENRKFIGHTSFDLELSLFLVNVVKNKNINIIYDPCMGSGSILFAAALLDTYTIGSDISREEMVGDHYLSMDNYENIYSAHEQTNNYQIRKASIKGNKNIKINRKGVKTRAIDQNVYSNFKQFQLQKYHLGSFVSSVDNIIIRPNPSLAIITDPPYGIRVSDKKIEEVIKNIKISADKILNKNNMIAIIYPKDKENTILEIFSNYKIIEQIEQQMPSYKRTFFILRRN